MYIFHAADHGRLRALLLSPAEAALFREGPMDPRNATENYMKRNHSLHTIPMIQVVICCNMF